MCESKTIMDAVIDLIACYYVFDIVYPKSVSGCLLFIQQHVFNIKDKQLSPPYLTKLISNISSFS